MTRNVVTVASATAATIPALTEKRRIKRVPVLEVTYGGAIGSENERLAARVAAQTVPGVRGVVDRRIAYRDLPAML